MKLNRILSQVMTIYDEYDYCEDKQEIINMCINMIDVIRLFVIEPYDLEIDIAACDYEFEEVINEIRYRYVEYEKIVMNKDDEQFINDYKQVMRKNMKNMLDVLIVKTDILQNEERLFMDNYDLGNFREITLIIMKIAVLKNLLMKLAILLDDSE